jgi:beta-carotene hydroxylase
MFNKYQTNQLIFTLSFVTLIGFYSLVFTTIVSYWLAPLFIIPTALIIHYQYNTVHIASHHQMSKNKYWNNFLGHLASIICGATFAGFTTNHLLHHKNPNHSDNDPDYQISTKMPLFLIAFKIWYHDYSFFSRRLYLTTGNLFSYFTDRFVQIALITAIVVSGNLFNFLIFWSLPVWLVGTMNGLFLFYFPHYTTDTVEQWKLSENPNLFQQFSLVLIQISLHYHTKHHQKITGNSNYYPLFSYLKDSVENKKLLFLEANV